MIFIEEIYVLQKENYELKQEINKLKDEIEYLIYLYDYKLNDKLNNQIKHIENMIK